MFDLGWTELLLIGIVALIVVGPKDLPGMFRAIGNFTGKAKRMAREFSRAMNDAADDTGVGEVGKMLNKASQPMQSAADELRKSSKSFTQQTMDSGKPKLDPKRQADADKISKKTAEVATKRKAAEAAVAEPDTVLGKAVAKKAAVKSTATKKAPAKPSTTSKIPAKAALKATAAKATPAKKPAARKTAEKPAPKSAAAKKPAARKPVGKKTTKDQA